MLPLSAFNRLPGGDSRSLSCAATSSSFSLRWTPWRPGTGGPPRPPLVADATGAVEGTAVRGWLAN
jgi:hypothetical protein